MSAADLRFGAFLTSVSCKASIASREKYGVLIAQQIIGVNLGAQYKLNALKIAGSEVKLLIELAAGLDQQRRLAGLKLVQRGAEQLCLALGDIEVFDYRKLPVSQFRRKRRAECA